MAKQVCEISASTWSYYIEIENFFTLPDNGLIAHGNNHRCFKKHCMHLSMLCADI